MAYGKIFLIPTFLSKTASADELPVSVKEQINFLDVFIVEEIKTARRFLRKTGYSKDFGLVTFFELSEHTPPAAFIEFLLPAEKGKDMGLLSEAGSPCIADPGSGMILLAHQIGIPVIPVAGATSIHLALMASGLNGQKFTFHGYLPIDKHQRKHALKEIEKEIRKNRYTQIFIETPYRNGQLFDAILNACAPDVLLCVACNITSEDEFIKTKTLAEWKTHQPDIDKKPAVFLMNI
ncbi:MAG: SAM-dependent methyltransferase [Bacteroidetes bacterium]|nr:SAM-dependent methyltransferase [Bacteroidota bacterium]